MLGVLADELRRRVKSLEDALHAAHAARAMAEEQRAEEQQMRVEAQQIAESMAREFAIYHTDANAHEVRQGRPPRRTPQAFARFDHTVLFGTPQGKK